jgi:hypothetical protein
LQLFIKKSFFRHEIRDCAFSRLFIHSFCLQIWSSMIIVVGVVVVALFYQYNNNNVKRKNMSIEERATDCKVFYSPSLQFACEPFMNRKKEFLFSYEKISLYFTSFFVCSFYSHGAAHGTKHNTKKMKSNLYLIYFNILLFLLELHSAQSEL